MSEELDALKKLIRRERKARKASEKILEEKSLELFQANQELKSLYSSLETRYQKIVDQANDIIYRGDKNGYCIFINPICEKILGYKAEELLGKQFHFLVIPEDQVKVGKFYLHQKTNLIEATYNEFRVRSKNGDIIWLGQNVSLIIEKGELLGISAVARDITKQKQAEIALKRSEEKYKRIIANMRLGLLEVDTNGKVIKAYSRFCEMIGYTEEELIGKNPADILTDSLSKQVIEDKNELRSKGLSDVYEVKCKRKDGETIWLMISGAPRFDPTGKYIGSMGIHMDITDQKKLLSQVENAKAMAEESSKAKEDFLAHMSHEIRTPLNAVIGMTHLLEDTDISAEQEDYLKTIQHSSEQLLSMVSDILDISKIESGELEFHETVVDLKELLHAQVSSYQMRAKSKGLNVQLDWDTSFSKAVKTDKKYMNQIFANLLSNAEKFTEKGGINVQVNKLNEDDTSIHLQFKVSDTGIGMTNAQCAKIFDSFQQADHSTSVKYGGTGLGLSIAKHLVELMGGDIRVESVVNKGTTFVLDIPFFKTEKTVIQNEQKQATGEITLSGMSVLVAEDNQVNQKFIKKLLEKFDVDYTLVDDGKKCVEKIKNKRFDALLLDINMPELNGYEVAEIIRSTENPNQNSPIVALTASALLNDREKALEIGMNEHLTKPFSPTQLKQLLAKYHHLSEQKTEVTLHFDEEYLNDLYQGDVEFEMEMLELFLKNSPEDLEKLCASIQANDWEASYQYAHKMKPTFRMVGLATLEALMERIESMSKENPEKVPSFYKAVEPQFKEAFISVRKRLNILSPKK